MGDILKVYKEKLCMARGYQSFKVCIILISFTDLFKATAVYSTPPIAPKMQHNQTVRKSRAPPQVRKR